MSVPNQPFVTICTVTHNRRKFLPLLQECIRNQTYPKKLIEWVIVDDSTDRSESFQPDPKLGLSVNYIHLAEKLVLGEKRNVSHQYCRGEIIVYMDDDDWYPPTRVAHAVDRLSGSEALIAGSTYLPLLFLPERELWLAGPYNQNHATANTFAFKRELLNQTQYENTSTHAEEKSFLKDYSLPMIQLEPKHTILCIGHGNNTFDKRKLKSISNNKIFKHVSSDLASNNALSEIIGKYEDVLAHSHQRLELIFVAGPWGSGSSAIANILQSLGVEAPGPYFQTNDPRTPISYEMQAFRAVVQSLIDESTLNRKVSPSQAIIAIQEFSQKLKDNNKFDQNTKFLLKLPSAALLLPEICTVFKTNLIICLRSLNAIEASRQRRSWPAYLGKAGAEKIYGALFTYAVN